MLYRIKKPESQIYSGIFLQKNGGPGGHACPRSAEISTV